MSASLAMRRRVVVVPGESGGYGGSVGRAFVAIGIGREKIGAVTPYPGGPAMGSGGGDVTLQAGRKVVRRG